MLRCEKHLYKVKSYFIKSLFIYNKIIIETKMFKMCYINVVV